MATLEVGAGKAYATLQEAVGVAGNGDTIVLTEDISESTLTIDGKDITVDLGGFTFTGKTYIKNGADVVISNGKMTVAGNSPSFNDAVIKVMDGEVEVDGVKTVVPTSLKLNGVEVDGGEAINSRYYTNAVTYDATGGLTVTDCTITAGMATRNADCESIGSISSGAVGIYAPNKSGGKIEITNSTITGGYGKTDAEWTGYVSQLFSPGGYGISLHGTSEVTITDSTVNGGGSNWYNAGMAINVSNQFSGTLDVDDSAVNGGNAEGQVGNYGQGGAGIYTNMSTSCESIDITGSTITGGAGGKSSNAFGIEYRNEDIKMNITESTVAAGNGEDASGGGAAIAIYNSNKTQIVLDDVKLNGEGNGSNTVIKGGDKGITVAGPVEITGGTLDNTNINVDATDLDGSEEIISGATGDGVKVNVSGNEDAVVIVDGGKTYVTTETDPANADTSIIYVNNNWDGKEANAMVGVGKFMGVNAFADVNTAEAVAEAGAGKMVIEAGASVVYDKDMYYFLNTNPNEGGENNAFDNVVDADKTYDLDVNGTLKAYQVLINNAVTNVSKTGKLIASGEALRIMGGSITVEGNRAENAGVPAEIYTGRWGGGVSAGADTQIQGGYFMINQEAAANFSNTVILVHAGFFNVDNATADFSNTYIYLGDGGGYGAVNVSFTNGAEVTFADNTTMVYDKTYTVTPAMNITVDGTSSLTISADSSITASTLTVADGGKFIIDAIGFEGVKKVVDLAGESSLEGKVTINGEGVTVIYGADGDVTLVNVDTSVLYVDSSFSGEFGADLGDGKYYGLNAFSTISDAMKGDSKNIVVQSNITDSIASLGGYNITTDVEGGVTITNTYDNWVYVSGNAVIGSGVTINSGYYFYYGTGNEISGSLVAAGQNYHRYDNVITVNPGGYVACNGEAFIIRYNTENGSAGGFRLIGDAAEGAALADRTAQMHASYYSFYSGTIDATDTLITGGPIWMNNTTDGGNSKAVALLDNTIWTSNGNLKMTGNAFVTLTNGSTLQVVDFEGYEGSSLDATSVLTIQDSVFNAETLVNNGTINVSGESTLNIAKFVGNDIVASGVLKDSNLTMEEFDWETGNVMVDGELEVQNGTFSNVQFRADEGEKVTISGKVVAAGATQFKAVDGEVVLAGEFTSDVSEASSIELEGDDAKLTVEKDGKAKITGGFYLNGGTATITGNLAEDADLAALTREDAQIDAAYSTWGGTYAADVTLTDTYVWNAMISLNNADTVVTVDNSLLVGWMSFDINAGTLIATNGGLVNHQAAEGWTWSTIGADGALVVEKGSTFNAAKTNLTNNGSITVDGLSSFIANTIIWGENATITIDATDFTGTKKVIDLAGTSSLEGKVTLVNGEGITAIYGEDGDVMLTDASKDFLYVNAAWADAEFGDVVGEGYIFGYNAFAALGDAAGMIATDGSDTTIKFESDVDVSGDQIFSYGSGAVKFVADSPVTITQKSSSCGFYFVEAETADILIGENVTFELSDNVSDFAVWYGPNLTVDGTITGGANWGSLYIFYGEHKVSSTGTVSTGRVQVGFADLTVTGDAESDRKDAHIDTNYLLIEESTFTAENAIIDAGAVHDSNNGGLRYGASEFNIINTDFNAASVTLKHADTVFNVSGGNLNVSGTLSNNSTINVAGESTIRAAITGSGAINLNDATLKDAAISGDFSGGLNVVDGTESTISGGTVDLTAANVYVGSDASLVITDDAEVTFGMIQDIYSVITVDDADLTIAGGSLDAGITVTGDGDLTITGELKLGRNVTITLDNGDLDLVNGGTLTGTKGQLVMDHESTITFDDVITAGTLTVDISDYTAGTYRLFDYVGTGSMSAADYEALLGDVMNNDKILVLNNDLFLTDQDVTTLYVNASYDADSAADAGYLYGINAFSSLNDALANVTSDTEEIVVSSDIAEALAGSTCSGAIVKGGENDVVITDTDNSNYVNFTNANIGEGVTFDAKYFYLYGNNTFEGNVKASATFYSSGKLTLTGNAEVYTTMSRYYTDSTDGIYVVGTAAAGEGKNAAVQFKATNYLGHYSGTFSVKDTAAEFGYILLNGDTDGEGYSSAKLVLDNAKVSTIGGPNTQPGQVLMNGDAAIIATNDSVLDFRGPNNFGYLSMGENNTLSLTDSELLLGRSGQGTTALDGSVTLNGASILSNGDIVNGGTISVTNGSTVSVAGTLTNNGSVLVSGESTLNIGKLAGAITVADATIMDGSVIGKAADALAGIYIGGTEVNFAGTVTLDTAVNANMDKDGKEGLEATTININKGADVTWNAEKEYNLWQGGFNTDSSDKLNVYGKLTVSGNNVYLKAETLVDEGAEFIINDAGFQNTYGKLTVKGKMNITDTSANGYQNIKLAGNDNASTTGELDVDGGTLTIDGPSFAFGGGYKSNGWVDVAEAQVTIRNGGKITANSIGFRNGVSSTLTLNNGTFEFTEAGDFGTVHSTVGTTIDNNGTIIAENGSTLNFSDRKLENSGTITITASTFTVEELVNTGSVTMDTASQIIWSGSLSGSVTVDLSNYVDGKKQLFDYTGSETITDAYYQNIISNTWSNAFYVEDGDLYYDFAKVTHEVNVTEDYVIPEGTEFVVVDPGDTTLNHADTNLAVNGIEAVVKSGTFNDTISGGAVASTSDYKTWDDDTFDTNLTVEGGTFNKIVMGGTRVDKGNSEQIGDSNLTISGGTFNSQVVGGMAYADSSLRGNAILTGDVNLTISGGTFSSWIYGGSISGKGATSGSTLVEGDITITIDASSNAITFEDDAHIVAGSYQSGVVDGNTTVVFTGLSANLGMDADNLVWGGSSADVYVNGTDGSRIFQTAITGNRTVSFDAFSGDFTARIRGFNTLDAVNGAEVTALAGDLSDIEFWNFDTESSIAGSFSNNFAGDKFDVDVTDWDKNEVTLFSGDVTGFEDMTVTVTLGDETATLGWDAELSRYANDSYQLTFDAENKVVKFGALA